MFGAQLFKDALFLAKTLLRTEDVRRRRPQRNVTDSLVEVEVQHGGVVLAAHHQGLLQPLQVLHLQVLTPLSKGLPLHFLQKLICLAVAVNDLLARAYRRQQASFVKHLRKTGTEAFYRRQSQAKGKESHGPTSRGRSRLCLESLMYWTKPAT